MVPIPSLLLALGALFNPASSELNGENQMVLELPSIMDIALNNPVLKAQSRDEKAESIVYLLKNLTSAAQAPFLKVLKEFEIESYPFWITNTISMKNPTPEVIAALQALPGNCKIRKPFKAWLNGNVTSTYEAAYLKPRAGSKVELSVSSIGAEVVWATGNRGDGVIVASIDTGVMGDHPDLKDNYAGHFFDATKSKQPIKPYDDVGHGTHVMGTICGKNGIGVAPNAKWVACKGLGKDGGTDESLTECAQWIINLKEKPTLVANSWDHGKVAWFEDVIAAWNHLGIIPVFSIGDGGDKCGTAKSPGDSLSVISVGATTKVGAIAKFSSRGPPKVGLGEVKPDISAPGVGIRSAWKDGGYKTMSGTSMACPLVAGAVALMRAVNPFMSFQAVRAVLRDTANKNQNLTSADLSCDKKSGKMWPNNAYGYGIINVAKAIKEV